MVLTLCCFNAGGDGLSIVSANYVVRATWASGYVVDVSVVVDCLNSGRKNRFGVNGFSIEFEMGDGSVITKSWNAKLTQDGSVVTAHHKRFCAPVYREQALLYFGFESQVKAGPVSPALPLRLKVNGQVCAASACFARDLADCRNDHLEEDDEDEYGSPGEVSSSGGGGSRSVRQPTPEPERKVKKDVGRCSSAPPVLYHSFGLASPRFQSEDDESRLATTFVCAERKSFQWGEDEDHSIAETVRHRQQRNACADLEVEGGVEGDTDSVSSPPLIGDHAGHAACLTRENHERHVEVSASRKRKFVEDDVADHDGGVCSQISTEPPSPSPPLPPAEDKKTWSSPSLAASSSSLRYPKTLLLDYYRRSRALKKRKYLHMDYLDMHFKSREQVILNSVLDDTCKPIVMEPNMFPYDTPHGVSHWTLWSRKWLEEEEVEAFVDGWLAEHLPDALEWNHDDNMADGLSINLFHLHVYIRCP